MSALQDIVDRAIDYTNCILRTMPSYRATAAGGLRRLRSDLARRAPDDPALTSLDAYLAGLDESPRHKVDAASYAAPKPAVDQA